MTLINIEIQPVPHSRKEQFRVLVEDYWWELMQTADAVRTEATRSAYFNERFEWEANATPPYWALRGRDPVAFIHFTASSKRARVLDFYVCPEVRRQGVGTRLVKWLLAGLDRQGITQIDLSVRRDNHPSLVFWESQGFTIGHHDLIMHRNPDTGEAYKGALSSDFDESDLGFTPWKERHPSNDA